MRPHPLTFLSPLRYGLFAFPLFLVACPGGKDTGSGSEGVGEEGGGSEGGGIEGGGSEGGGSEGGGSEGGGSEGGGSEGGSEGGGTGGDDTGGSTEGRGWTTVPLAALTELSSGECPDLSASGTSSFLSSDEDRTVTAIIPEGGTEDAPLVVFFHGLTTPDATPNPTEYMAEALDLQSVADEFGVVILLPEAPLRDLFGLEFYLWDVENLNGTDLVLYDDLRTCAADELNIDLNRVHAFGFSGGALFTTVVAGYRADTLASMVEHSGGSDITIPFYSYPVSEYQTPAWTLPALLGSGGDTDVWPSTSLALIDFEAATDNLSDELVADSSFVVRCHHDSGHTITTEGYLLTIDWLLAHTYGEPSVYETDGLGADSSWCEALGGS